MKEIHSALRYKNADIAAFSNDTQPDEHSDNEHIDEFQSSDHQEQLEAEIFPSNFDEIAEEIEVEYDDSSPATPSPETRQHSTLKSYCPTRWHSLLIMIKSMIINHRAINDSVQEMDRSELWISKKDLILMENLSDFLEQFKTAVDMLSSEKQPTINKAAVFRCHLKSILDDSASSSSAIDQLKSKMSSNFNKRFPLTELMIIASLLDPKFKDLDVISDWCEENFTSKKALIKTWFHKLINDDSGISNSPIMPVTDGTQLAHKFSTNTNTMTSFDLEIDSYLLARDTKDLLEFWDERKSAWPSLYKLALAVLAVPATSVPVERLFSIAGLTLNKKRSQLHPERLSKICFIHDNFNFVSKNCEDFDY
ncbi:zinc finger protein 618-like [Panonychus citri]|uniref:zinc finger protein 618-like n=1 Tax=Panonychus citri TaxID=50023 RepID=UPI002307FE30|nr:zinc finger protein 618-like [Panonychus citri]